MPRRRPTLLFPLASLAALGLAGCQPATETPAAPPRVLVRPAAPASADSAIYNGEIRARHEADLAFRVGGRLVARLVDAGAEIKPGQPLARLDPADLELAATAARAQLAAAESDLATTQADKERYAGLLAKKFVSQAAYDARENAWNASLARLEQARSQARLSGNQAGYGTLSAEYPAVVTAVLAEAGQVVAPGQPVLRVARPDEKEVAIAVPEGRLDELRAARELRIALWSDPAHTLPGTLRELSPAADPATRTYAARIRIPAAPADWRLGMTARVTLARGGDAAMIVPLGAVIDTGNGPLVRVVADGKIAPRPVRVFRFREDGALVAGLQSGEQVVISGAAGLVDGQPVQAVPATPPAEQR